MLPTISKPAQEALAQFSRAVAVAPLSEPDDLESWKKVQARIEKKRTEANLNVVKQCQPRI